MVRTHVYPRLCLKYQTCTMTLIIELKSGHDHILFGSTWLIMITYKKMRR